MSINYLLIFFVLVVVAMIAFILVQKGTGATAGSAFGSGASSTVFGAKGSGNFLTKTTMILAFLFFAISMFMAVNASKQFTASATGEVDLGVIGKLDTSTDVPEMSTTENLDASEDSDIPALKEESNVESSNDALDSNATGVSAATTQNVIEQEAKDLINQKVDEIKADVEEKVEETKDSIDG